MKKIIFLFVIALLAFSCEKDDTRGKLDPDAVISIRPETSTRAGHLSPLNIVRQATDISFFSPFFQAYSGRGFIPEHRDTVNVRLLMWGTDIIDQEGNYVTEFIEGRDFVIRRNLASPVETPIYDTIAFIPQYVVDSASVNIRAAYDRGDFTEVYELFDNAFTFRPITGAEWRTLKEQGDN